mgnify:CR=1 FL=1
MVKGKTIRGQHIVMMGLIRGREEIDEINNFFKGKGWGGVKYVMEFKTEAGQGGSGGRNDTILLWQGTGDELGKFSVQRLGLADPPRWLEDYIENNKDIIPSDILERLKKLTRW